MRDLARDLRHGLRSLLRSPAFTLSAVMTLALGIGAATSVFSVVDTILIRPLPYPDADRLVDLSTSHTDSADHGSAVSGADYLDLRDGCSSFSSLAAHRRLSLNLAGDGGPPLRVLATSVTPNFFSTLGVEPLLGRTFSPLADGPGQPRTAVLGHALWRSRFAADPRILGTVLRLSGTSYTVVGVMPAGFVLPEGSELYLSSRYRVPEPPFDFGGDPSESRSAEYLGIVGRLRQGIGLGQARAEVQALERRLHRLYPKVTEGRELSVVPLQEEMVGSVRAALLVLAGAVAFLLAISAANVAHLLLVRATRRRRELAVRIALGAGWARIVRQLLVESLLVASLGGVAGVLSASWGTELLLALVPAGVPRTGEVAVDARVLAFAALVSLVTGILFGLAPLVHLSRSDLQQTMKAGDTAPLRGGGRVGHGLVVAQVAVSLVLVVGAALLSRSLLVLEGTDPGFDPSATVAGHLALPAERYPDEAHLLTFYHRTLDRVSALPGVEAAGMVLSLPMHSNLRGTLRTFLDRGEGYSADALVADAQVVSPGYFRALRIPLRRGRLLTPADDEHSPPVALVNEAFVDHYLGGSDPIGRRISWSDPTEEGTEVEWSTIVGVVGNTALDGLDRAREPMTYQPYPQALLPFMTVVARTASDPTALVPALRSAVLEVDPELPLYGVATLDDVLSGYLARRRFSVRLVTTFGAMALLLAAVGLGGVLAFTVERRRRELGVRRALGAAPRQVVFAVVGSGLRLILLGVALGATGALALTRLITSQVHGVSPFDPSSYAAGILILIAAGTLASLLPALRAACLDPLAVLRSE